jgi:EmrB/QacA subfamily drug resistance transporter
MRKGNDWVVLVTLSLGFLMTLVDLTIVNVAIPQMTVHLHASLAAIDWVINAYIIVLASMLLTSGRLGDLIGRPRMFLIGVCVFTFASVACGLSGNVGELIAARAVQGLGAAMLLPQTMAIIIATFPPHRRGTALGIWGMVAGIAAVAGPVIGGTLVSTVGWRWIFFVNVPVGVIVVVAGRLLLPASKRGDRQPLDLPGVLSATGGLVGVTYGLVEGQQYSWGPGIVASIGAGVVLLAVFVLIQARRQDRSPLVPFALFRDRNYALMGGANLIVSLGMLGTMLPLTLYLQEALGFSALKAGLTMVPSSLASMVVAPLAGRAANRYGKYLLITGFVAYAAGMTWIALAASSGSRWQDFVPGFLVAGVGVGCVMSPMQTIASRAVTPRLAGAAAGVLNTLRQFGSALGSAISVAVLQNRLAAATGHGASAGHGSAARFVEALRPTMAIPIAIMLLGACLALAVVRRPPAVAPAAPAQSSTPAMGHR